MLYVLQIPAKGKREVSAVAVDTSVLVAIFKGDPRGELWLDCLQSAAETATLLVFVRCAGRSAFLLSVR